jgi:curved DNA-binding protein CbpA
VRAVERVDEDCEGAEELFKDINDAYSKLSAALF